MILSNLFILTLFAGLVERITGISDALYQFCNSLAGRSWLLDNLIALPLDNQLVKAAIVGGCFLAAWHVGKDEATTQRNRCILLVTLIAAVFVIATTKTFSKTVFLPRPFIQSQKAFHLEGDQLVESQRLNYRVPLDEENQKSYQALLKGEVVQNDLGSFPSDHAGFYVTIAVGILLASRAIGWLAVGWTFLVMLSSRVITGQHSPLDILAGAGIGIVILVLFQLVLGKWLQRLMNPIINWTLRHQAFATGLIFIAVFEIANTLQNLRPLLKTGVSIAKHFIKG
ncbi:MAG: phosphatase PAP2 family protein [Acidobacteria bacterium]|nr:phosphatase PAP2 family protein [Acidobacteriota bacterium]